MIRQIEGASMKKKKFLTIYIAAAIVFLFYLLSANSIIAKTIFRDTNPLEVKFSSISSVSVPIFWIDNVYYTGGLNESISVNGWAFCETEQDNSEKRIDVVFKDYYSDTAYMLTRPVVFRADVYGANSPQYKIYNAMDGFYANIDTFSMPIGVYELYINVKENDTAYGIVSTGKYYRKTSEDIYEYDPTSIREPVEIGALELGTYGQANIESVSIEYDLLRIQGWGSYSAEANASQKLYVEITSEDGTVRYYPAVEMERQDVAKHFSNDSYKYCGFKVSLTASGGENFKMSIIAETGGKYYRLETAGQTEIETD